MPTRAVRAWLATPSPPSGAVPSRPTITESANKNSGSATSAPNAGTASRSISASWGFWRPGESWRPRSWPGAGPGTREGGAGEGMARMLIATIIYLQTVCGSGPGRPNGRSRAEPQVPGLCGSRSGTPGEKAGDGQHPVPGPGAVSGSACVRPDPGGPARRPGRLPWVAREPGESDPERRLNGVCGYSACAFSRGDKAVSLPFPAVPPG